MVVEACLEALDHVVLPLAGRGGDSYVEDIPSLRSTAHRNPGYEDMERSRPDTRRMATLPDWKPELALDDILRRVISYIREQRADSVGSP